MFIRIDDSISVAGQVSPDDMARAAEAGFVRVVNNRPDGEAPDQPAGVAIEAAARAAGLDYTAIPVAAGFSMPQVEAMAGALEADGPVLAFCRSGTRSTNLWALAAAARGGEPDAIVSAAAAAGYDVSALMPALRQLSGQAR